MQNDKANSKRLIAEAAISEFGEHGLSGARTERIARRAGVNKQLIYYYYGSKAKLFAAVSTLAAQSLSIERPSGTSQASATEKLRTCLTFLWDGLEAHPNLAALLTRQDGTTEPESPSRWGNETVRVIAGVISEGQGLGFFRDDVDPITAARQAVALLVGYSTIQPVIDPGGESAASWLESASHLVVNGLTW